MPVSPNRGRLLQSLSTVALAAGLAQAVSAQTVTPNSYNAAAPTIVSGNVVSDFNTPNTDVYTVTTPTAVIDFTPTDAATNPGAVIDFQNAGTTAYYRGAPGLQDFTVLNRIVPTDASRPIAFNGRVVTELADASRGGSVWFYSPAGIVIGDGSVFDVGSLLLSTADPTGGTGTISSTSTFTLDSGASQNGIINVLSGGTINAANPGSYVALVAPIVFQAGTVNTNGAAAYVAAERATLTFDQGLFTIDVAVGSSAASGFPLQHRGTTRFVDSNGPRRAYLVSVPKNDAITMVVESAGTLGFDVATTANIQNGAIYLSAGPTRVNEADNLFYTASPVVANLAVNSGTFNAPVRANVFDAASIRSTADLSFASNLTVVAGAAIDAGAARVGETLGIGGDLNITVNPVVFNRPFGGVSTLSSLNGGTTQVAGNVIIQNVASALGTGSLTAGNANLYAQDGNVAIGGSLFMRSIATASQATTAGLDNGDATAGATNVAVNAGRTLTVGTTATLSATAEGGTNTGGGDGIGGAGQGGTVLVANAGTLTIAGTTSIDAGATGGTRGGIATGGTATVNPTGGTTSFGGALTVAAVGMGGSGGGAGTGGAARIIGIGGSQLIVTGATSIDAGGIGGSNASGSSGGAGTGGTALLQLQAANTRATLAGLTLNGAGFGSGGGTAAGSIGGAGIGTAATIDVGAGSVLTAGATLIRADAFGGGTAVGAAGGATGGATVLISRGTATLASAFLTASANGGTRSGGAAAAGLGRAGTAVAQADAGGTLTITDLLNLASLGTGGSVVGGTGAGGAGIGNDARIVATAAGAVSIGRAIINAGATGGGGLAGNGGAATASTGSLSQGSAGTIAVTTSTAITATANAGSASGGGVGGSATGGDVRVAANDGLITLTGPVGLGAGANGGFGLMGGGATGGLTNIGATTGTVRLTGFVTLSSGAVAGSGSVGIGGNAQGGQALLGTVGLGGAITGGTSIELDASATGGAGTGGAGGFGTGGTAQAFSTATITTNTINAVASGTGGDSSAAGTSSGVGGTGSGGFASIVANGGAINAAYLAASAIGRGGSALSTGPGSGGLGQGGLARIDAQAGGSIATVSAGVAANGSGGPASIFGGSGGAGRGGNDPTNLTQGAFLVANGGTVTITTGTALIQSVGSGGMSYGSATGGSGIGGLANIVAYDGVIDASRTTNFNVFVSGSGGPITFARNSFNVNIAGGGNGAAGIGGNVVMAAGTTAAAATATGRLLLGANTRLNAEGVGGAGAAGLPGQNGGVGGAGNAGRVDLLAQSGNGVLVATGETNIQVNGTGGAGGAAGGTGGVGGRGGAGVGGQGNVGTSSATDTSFTVGSATFANVTIAANGTGGAGGAGGAGQGGIGGAASAQGYSLIARGSPVRAVNVTITANATGGAGGTSIAGAAAASGAASAGLASALSTNRANRTERGALTAGLVTLTASATSVGGGATTAGVGQVFVENGDATLASLSITTAGANAAGTTGTDISDISAVGGTLAVTGATRANLVGDLGLYTGAGGALNFGSLTVSTPGTIAFGSFAAPSTVPGNITVNGDTVLALGALTLGGGSGGLRGSLTVTSAGPIAMQDLAIGGTLSLTATTGGIATGALTADAVSLTAPAGAIGTGAITSARGILLNGMQGVSTGALQALNRITATSGAALTTGNVESTGGTVTLAGATALTTGNIRAAGSINLTTAGVIRVGDLTAGTGLLADDGSVGAVNDGTGLIVPTGLATGFDAASIVRCDDCAGPAAMLGFTANFFGSAYTTAFVSNNGYITFNSGQSSYTPTGLGATYSGQPLIAAFFSDVDTRNPLSAQATYGTGTYGGRPAFAATWNGVGYYSSHADKLNNFQIILADRSDTGAGNFDVYYNYSRIQWETGDVNGGVGGLGGNSAAAGFNAGTGNRAGTFFEFPGSRVVGSFLDGGPNALAGLNGTGQVVFTVRNGSIVQSVAEVPTIRVTNTSALAGATPSITTGNLSAQAVEVRGAGQVTTGGITVADLGRGGQSAPDPLRTVVQANGALTTGNIDGAGLITLTTTQGGLFAGNLNGVGAITLNAASGDINAASIAGRAGVSVDATAGAITLGGASAATALRVAASGGLTLNGAISAPTIDLIGSDIAIGNNATVSGTSLTLTALSPTAPATIGGTGAGAQGGYTLDAAEFGRLRGGSIRFVQQGRPAGDAQIILRDLVLNGSAAPQGTTANLTAPGGTISFTTSGSIRIIGDVRLTNAAPADTLSFRAGESFDLVTDAGGVGVFASGTTLGGRLAIDAADVTVGDAALFARAGQTDFDNVTADQVIAAIDTPAVRTRPEGALQAGRIDIAAADFIAIQNSGTADLRGGFSAGSGGLAITRRAGATDPLQIVINGRVSNQGGTFQTNGATAGFVTFPSGQQGVALDPRSTLNGCVIGGTCPGTTDQPIQPIQQIVALLPNIRSTIEAVAPLSVSSLELVALPEVNLTAAIDTAALTSDSLITDPVAAGGNPSLWGDVSTPEDERRRRATGMPKGGVRP